MVYQGSKARVAKFIIPIIQDAIDTMGYAFYLEPFCGGCNVIDKIKCNVRVASDNNQYLIALLKNLNKLSDMPDAITKQHYKEVRMSYNLGLEKYQDWYTGAVGFLSSQKGRFFDGGYSGTIVTKTGVVRNYYDEAKRNLMRQSGELAGVEFICKDYKHWGCLENAAIYCDPPYKCGKGYCNKSFNSNEFWDWVRGMSKKNLVYVSETEAPKDFITVCGYPTKRIMNTDSYLDCVEKLFEWRG